MFFNWGNIGTIVTVVGTIIGIESLSLLNDYPIRWWIYGLSFIVVILLLIRAIIHESDSTNTQINKITEALAPKFPKIFEKDNLKIDINRIPEPTAALVGRQAELAQITAAFEGEKTKVVAIIAGGGVGKSALTWNWLQQMQPNYGGAELVFGWSFYSQGSHQTANSSAPFFQEALPFFGFEGKLPSDEIEKARALAELLRKKRSLLIWDGLEPLQHPTHLMGGELADVAIKELLRCVRYYGLGGARNLVLISSRQPVVDLEQFDGYLPMDLQTLAVADGAQLLQNLGCSGGLASLEAASRDMNGHALALVLLGKLLRERFEGRIERRDSLPDLFEEAKEGGHALRVVRYYDEVYWQDRNFFKRIYQNWFGEVAERALLQLLGLFDRPMGVAEKEVLVQKAELARPLALLDATELRLVERRLEQASLLLRCDGERWEWDTHPLIRSYFAKSLQEKYSKLYKQAQLVLFEYYQAVPDKEQPDTLEELEPLYRAVMHGCLAGEYQKTLNDVYWERIQRSESEAYSLRKFGAYAQDLTAISNFFPNGWDKSITSLLTYKQAWLLSEASYCLMSLGRLGESANLRIILMELAEKQGYWKYVTLSAVNLVTLNLHFGKIDKADIFAQKTIFYADKLDDCFHKRVANSKFAITLHKQGNLKEALKYFEIANKLQNHDGPDYPRAYSQRYFQYYSLLLDTSKNTLILKNMLENGKYILRKGKKSNNLLSIALGNIIIAQTFYANTKFLEALKSFNQAIQEIRKAKTVHNIPILLLIRAKFHRQQQNFKQSQQDLDESFDIINRCGMKLYLVDAMLLQANINLDLGETFDTKPIKNLVNLTGYHLRDPELDLVDARIALHNQDLSGFRNLTGLAKGKIEKMGYWGLMPELERVEGFEHDYAGCKDKQDFKPNT